MLDWNNQKNGCYLTAGVYLCPTATDGNPEDEPDWLKFEYIGVPPAQNARAWVSARINGGERVLYDEGWPEKQRAGRKVGRQEVKILLKDHSLSILENGHKLCKVAGKADGSQVTFPYAYLYLQMSSHSNYPAREVFFGDIHVKALSGNNPQH